MSAATPKENPNPAPSAPETAASSERLISLEIKEGSPAPLPPKNPVVFYKISSTQLLGMNKETAALYQRLQAHLYLLGYGCKVVNTTLVTRDDELVTSLQQAHLSYHEVVSSRWTEKVGQTVINLLSDAEGNPLGSEGLGLVLKDLVETLDTITEAKEIITGPLIIDASYLIEAKLDKKGGRTYALKQTPEAKAMRQALAQLKQQIPPFFIVLNIGPQAIDNPLNSPSHPFNRTQFSHNVKADWHSFAATHSFAETRQLLLRAQRKQDIQTPIFSFEADQEDPDNLTSTQEALTILAAPATAVIVLPLSLLLTLEEEKGILSSKSTYKLKEGEEPAALLRTLKQLSGQNPPYTIIFQGGQGTPLDSAALNLFLTAQGLAPQLPIPLKNTVTATANSLRNYMQVIGNPLCVLETTAPAAALAQLNALLTAEEKTADQALTSPPPPAFKTAGIVLSGTSLQPHQPALLLILLLLAFALLGLGAGLLAGLVPAASAVGAVVGVGGSMAIALGLSSLSPLFFGISISAGVFVGCCCIFAILVYGLGKRAEKAFGGSVSTVHLGAGGSGLPVVGRDSTITPAVELTGKGAGQTQVQMLDADTIAAGQKQGTPVSLTLTPSQVRSARQAP